MGDAELQTSEGATAPRPHRHPLWRKAPGRLLHHPVSFVALAVGALLVVVSTAAYPFFVSASQSELLASGIHASTVSRYAAGLTYRSTNIPLEATGPAGRPLYEERGAAFAEAAAASPQLDRTVTEILGPTVDVTLPGGVVPASGPVNGRLFAGEGAVDHLKVIEGGEGDGVWVPDIVAEPAGVGPGDSLELRLHGRTVPVTVAGVYRGLYALSPVGYFQPFNDEFYPPGGCFDCPTPPQPIVMDTDELVSIATELRTPDVDLAWQAPVREDPPPTLEQARAIGRFADDLRTRMERDRTPFGELVPCCGDRFTGPPRYAHSENVFRTAMPEVVQIVEERSAASQAPILVLSIAALVIAMAVVAAAAAFSFASRRVEAGVLTARGWAPGAVAAKSSLESLVPILVGAGAGFLAAATLIAVAGPDGAVDAAARSRALRASLIAVAVAVAVIAVVSAASYVAKHERRERFARAVLWVPWELFAFGAAWVLYRRLETQGGLVESGGLVRPGGAVFLFPLALSLAVGILAARVAVVVLGRRRPGRRPGISAWFMAERRLTSSSRLAALFLVASGMSLAVFASAQSMAGSLRATVDAKAGVFVGSDVQVRIGLDSVADTADYPFPVTGASRVRDAGAIGDTTQRFDLVAVDPATLEGAAYWDESFSDVPLGDLLDGLTTEPTVPLPIIVSNGAGSTFGTIDLAQLSVPVRIVGRTSSFPGTSSEAHPLIVVSRDVLEAYFDTAGQPNPLNVAQGATELWIRGPTSEVLASVDDLRVLPLSTLTADEVKDIPYIDAAIDTFTMLNVLGVVALVLVLVVAIVYVQARQRGRVLGAALSARMGMTGGMLRRSLVAELGAVLGVALVIGGLVGIVSVAVVVPTLDPLPTVPPDPLILRPWWALVTAGIVLALASVVGGALAARAARGASLGEVMRAAE